MKTWGFSPGAAKYGSLLESLLEMLILNVEKVSLGPNK